MKNLWKKTITTAMIIALGAAALTGCGGDANNGGGGDADGGMSGRITVVSREDGSGTRSAFTELMGILEDDKDMTTDYAEITNSTSVMMTTVSTDINSIGYVSLGSLGDSVKAIAVDGAEATVANIKSGAYPVSRNFNLAVKDNLSDLASDFVNFILSADGQSIVEEEGYISVADGEAYAAAGGLSGRITLAGSTSVAPVMEKLAHRYMTINSDVTIEIQQSGSSAGMTSAIEGVCDIGMSSRELKDSETAAGLTGFPIAIDGIAVIVNNGNSVDNLTSADIKSIFIGEITDWSELTQ